MSNYVQFFKLHGGRFVFILVLWDPYSIIGFLCLIEPEGADPESIDYDYHRNKTIKFSSNGITCLYQKDRVYPLKDTFIIENGHLFV